MPGPVILAKVTALPGKRSDVVEVLRELVEGTREEAGTLVYAMHIQPDDDDVVWFYERYADDAALAAHQANPNMRAVSGRLAGLLAGRPQLMTLEDVVTKGV